MKTSLSARAQTILAELVQFQSVAADGHSSNGSEAAIKYIVSSLKRIGFQTKIIGGPHSLIVGNYNTGASTTLGFYVHYDVQAAESLDKWHYEPFKLTLKGNRLYGRGTADDKGHLAQLLAVCESLVTKKQLKNNLLLLIEGEEEVGSTNLAIYLSSVSKLLAEGDVFYILDSSVHDGKTPLIEYGLRGVMGYELILTVADHDLHSGLAGNLVVNPAQVLARFLASLKDRWERITLPGFYDRVVKLDQLEDKLLRQTAHTKADLLKEFGVKKLYLPKGAKHYFASKTLPSLDINGLYSGFRDGFKTIIPHMASAKFSFRLVPNQVTEEIDSLFHQYVEHFFRPYPLDYKLNIAGANGPFLTKPGSAAMIKTAHVFNRHYPNPTVYNRSGGSIPAAEILSRLTQKPIIITGFVQPDANLHAPNENYELPLFEKGLTVLSDLINQ